MNPRITLITLCVDDLEASLRSYRDGLGLKTEGIAGNEFEHGAVAFFELQPGLRLAVWPRKSLAHDSGLPLGPGQRLTHSDEMPKNTNMAGYAPLHLLLVFMLLAAPLQPLLASPDSGHSTASHTSATHSESAGSEQAHHGNNPCNGASHSCGMCGTHCSALAPALYSPSANTLPESPVTSPLTLIGIDLPLLYKPPRSA